MPSREEIRCSRSLRWLGPLLDRPWLWRSDRRSLALGLAAGVFFGLLIPFAQGLFAGGVAYLLRANLPVAVMATFISNPFTTPGILFGAYLTGAYALGMEVTLLWESLGEQPWLESLSAIGGPLVLGLLLIATVSSLLAYCSVHLAWRIAVLLRFRRHRIRAAKIG